MTLWWLPLLVSILIRGLVMKQNVLTNLVLASALSLVVSGAAFAQTPAAPAAAPAADASCAAKAVDKNGKALAGAAKTSSIRKCCTAAAVGSDGKPLKGAAKASSIKKCESET
jgi:hypothetical protein